VEAGVTRLDELKILDRLVAHALEDLPDTVMTSEKGVLRPGRYLLTRNELRVVAKHLIRLMARDRQKAEQTRRHKIKKTLQKVA